MAAAYGVRLATLLFVTGALRGAVRGDDAAAALTVALLAAGFGFFPGLVAGGVCGRLATEQAVREQREERRHGETAATSGPGGAA